MNKSRLLIAIVLLAGLSVAVVMTTRSRQAQTKLEKPAATLPTVKKEQVTALEILRPKHPPIVLQKQNDKWRLTAPVNAEAGKSEVESAIDKLATLEATGIAATKKENHKRLELDDEHAIRVKAKEGDKEVADLYVGAAKSGGTMVRVEGSDTVLTAKGSFRYVFDQDVKDFRNRDVTDFDGKELTEIALTSAKGTFKFAKETKKEGETETESWVQAKGEKPIAKFDPSRVERLADALSSLRAVDFGTPEETDAVTGLDTPQGRARLVKKDGTIIEIAVGKQHKDGSEHFARVTGSDVVYRITNFSSERIMADAKAFEKPAPKAEPEGASGMPPMAGGGPEGMQNLPPELLKQLQDMQAGKAPAGHAHGN